MEAKSTGGKARTKQHELSSKLLISIKRPKRTADGPVEPPPGRECSPVRPVRNQHPGRDLLAELRKSLEEQPQKPLPIVKPPE